ncbi:MAG: hypothetical protein HYY84_04130 [Deltaproteobacteria bacterium]|nr:hypothetical protein [Deltaproteobacteria bacterium]
MELTSERVKRYARQIVLREVGRGGQEQLMAGCVAIAGNNDAAAVARTYLAASGVGTIVVAGAPRDVREALAAVNPDVAVFEIDAIPSGPEVAVAIDASFAAEWARTALDKCVRTGPWLHLGGAATGGHLRLERGEFVRCATCSAEASRGAGSPSLAMALGAAAATLASKIILGVGHIPFGRVCQFDRFGIPTRDDNGPGA